MDTEQGLRAVALYTTKPHGNFTLDIGENGHAVPPHLLPGGVRWAADAPTELESSGRCTLAAYPDSALVVSLTNGQGETLTFPVRPTAADGDTITARVPVAALSGGTWTGELRLADWSVPLPALPRNLPPAKWRRQGRPWYAKPIPDSRKQFALLVARTNLMKAVVRRLKP
ncbi:hypothetical protein ACFWFF_09210 [Streptomyces sp. NPDC060223]|uniref:hypothetical protein n=1 Tax=unclassified Streptomyces TaxID=2593676 RepID=UPI003633D30A